MSAPPIVALEKLAVRYGRRTALAGVSIDVPQGSVYALLGRNGAGKSSAVRCLLGLLKPTSGRVRLFGQDVWHHRATLMEKVGVVPEEPDLPPSMTAPALADFCGKLYRRWDAREVARRFDRFGVPTDVPAGRLSKGQKAQLALALALGAGPELLVLDDPTLGLDAVARKDFFIEVIDELSDRGITIILTTHDLAGVERIADRVGILAEGRLIVDEELDSLKESVRHPDGGAMTLEEIFTRLVDPKAEPGA